MPQDFTSRRPVRPPLSSDEEDKAMEQYIRDLNLDGMTLLPGQSQPQEMVGLDPDRLKSQMEKNQELKDRLLRDMAATWKCVRCGKEQSGKFIRVRVLDGKWEMINGKRTLTGGYEVLVCRDQTCNGAVIKIKDPYRSKLL